MQKNWQKLGLIVSCTLHVAFFILLLRGLPSLSYRPLMEPQPLFVEYAAIGPESLSPAMKKSAPSVRKTTKKPKEALPDKPIEPPPSSPPITEQTSPMEKPIEKPAEKLPEKSLDKPIENPKEEAPKKEPIKESTAKKEPPKPKKTTEEKALLDRKKNKVIGKEEAKKKVKPSAALAKVLAAVDKLEGSLEGKELDVPEGPKNALLEKIGDTLTMTEKDVLLNQLRECWNIPAGAPNPDTLKVTIKLEIGPDAIVRKAEIINKEKMNDPFFRAAAEAARRATFHPSCTPLKLPEGKYTQWKDLTLNFDPRYMMQ